MSTNRKNLLFVTCGFPPSGGMGIHRVTKFVKYLSRLNWKITVITTKPSKYGRKDHSLQSDISKETAVVQTTNFYTSPNATKYTRFRFLLDYYLKWYPTAIYRGIKLIRNNNITTIFASYPWTSHIIIAFMIAIMTRTKLVIDYRDYWNKSVPLLSNLLTALERKIMRKAKFVVFNNYHTSQCYKTSYNKVLKNKSFIIENGYDKEDMLYNSIKDDTYFNIVYTGNTYSKTIQRPFLMAVKELADEDKISSNDFQITFVGYENNIDKGYIYKKNIHQFFTFIDDIPHIDSVKIQLSADLLLLFANFNPLMSKWCTPGKFFEYLGAKKTILLLAHENSAMADYLRWTSSGVLVDPTDLKQIKNTILEFYVDWQDKRERIYADKSEMPRDDFNYKKLTSKLEYLLLKITV